MRLYHGSNMTIQRPRLIGQTRGLDFGAGFYLISSKAQAERFAHNVVRRMIGGEPTVSIYECDLENEGASLEIRRFDGADYEWLEYVKENRLKRYAGRAYDIVIGKVANDDVLPTLLLYMNGQLDAGLTIGALKTRKLVDQFCFKSERAIALLKYKNAEVFQ